MQGHDQSVRRSALVNETARRARRSVLERALYHPFIAPLKTTNLPP